MASQSSLHVVSKHNAAEHTAVPFNSQPGALGLSSIRVRTHLVGLSTNNLSYALLGTLMHWWDTYPVPNSAPAPYNNANDWGIVPAWGFARVLESTIPSIAPDSYLWGYWPMTSHSVDLKLSAAEPAGHWLEVSEHRQKLFALYNRYIQVAHPVDDSVSNANGDAWTASLKPVWECGYLINRYTFAAPSSGIKPAHPVGMGLPWTEADADLSRAVLINLSASGKTARSFAWQIAHHRDRATGGPLGLLQATSAPAVLPDFAARGSSLPVKSVHYDDLAKSETLAWINGFKPARVVIVDFGAPQSALDALVAAMESTSDKASLTIVAVGSESKPYTAAEIKALFTQPPKQQKVQLNTTGVRDHAMEAEGYSNYFKALNEAWGMCQASGGLGYSELTWRVGVDGAQGVHGFWEDLCQRKLKPTDAIVFKP
ncbi:hypothetical protein AURDEDRAFT_81812 [Auricularia subglabra TFB-10046 SS5]|nr:hypothetical protein AURDEDRAFT_81812 [Auricularia subglabra TFB-10046 SS5]